MEYLKEWNVLSEDRFNKMYYGETIQRDEVDIREYEGKIFELITRSEFKKEKDGDVILLDYRSYLLNGSGYTHCLFYGVDYDSLCDHNQNQKGYVTQYNKDGLGIYKYISDEIDGTTNTFFYKNIKDENDIINIKYGVPVPSNEPKRRRKTNKNI